MYNAPKLPALQAIASPLPPDMRLWVQSVTAILQSLTAQNPNAQGVDGAPTLRDLLNTSGITVRLVPGQTARDKPTLSVAVPAGSVDGLAEVINDYIVASGAHAAVTIMDSPTVNLTIAGQQIRADVVPSGIGHHLLFDLDTANYSHISAAEKARLAGVETLADVTDPENVAASINFVLEKAAPVDADSFAVTDSDDAGALKRITWSTIKAAAKAYFDMLYDSIGAAAAAIASHLASADPHTQYILETEKGAANGVATLGSDGLIPSAQIPPVAITSTFPVTSEAEMLALVAEKGDVAIRSDVNQCYVLRAEPASVLSNWSMLLTPTGAVLSVAGYTGAVTAGNLLDAVKTVDGAGSGLDADTLDGLNASDLALAVHTHTEYLTTATTNNIISAPTTIAADTSYVVIGYLNIDADLLLEGNLEIL